MTVRLTSNIPVTYAPEIPGHQGVYITSAPYICAPGQGQLTCGTTSRLVTVSSFEFHHQYPANPAKIHDTMAALQLTRIPALYWFQFAWVDPLVSFGTTVATLAKPSTILTAFFPTAMQAAAPLPPLYGQLLHHVAAWYLGSGVLSALLPRATRELRVWRVAQASTLAVDSVMLWSYFTSVAAQGRADPRAWRAEDWGSLGIVAWDWCLRVAFLAGVGLSGCVVDDGRGVRKRA
ncbi:hypothetical protein RB598_002224 [Gaeumannomyces tritici]